MTSSTRTCISILNAFSLVALFGGGYVIFTAVTNASSSNTMAMTSTVSIGLGTLITATLLRAASEGLRLLSEINERLQPESSSGTVPSATRRAA